MKVNGNEGLSSTINLILITHALYSVSESCRITFRIAKWNLSNDSLNYCLTAVVNIHFHCLQSSLNFLLHIIPFVLHIRKIHMGFEVNNDRKIPFKLSDVCHKMTSLLPFLQSTLIKIIQKALYSQRWLMVLACMATFQEHYLIQNTNFSEWKINSLII